VTGWAADVGCGSGCLAVTLALEFPALRVIALDLSPIALACTRENALKHGVAGRVQCVRGDLLTAIAPGLSLCVSNPPYVDPADRAAMQPEVRDFEPPEALFAADSGLAAARNVITQARPLLNPGATLLLEFGAGQAEALSAAATHAGYQNAKAEPDLSGLARVLVATA
jgi:release factor glutamine methyltransferase